MKLVAFLLCTLFYRIVQSQEAIFSWLNNQNLNHYCLGIYDFSQKGSFVVNEASNVPKVILTNGSLSSEMINDAQKICTSLSAIVPNDDISLLNFLKEKRHVLKSDFPYIFLVDDKNILLKSQVEPFVRATATRDFNHIFKRITPMSSAPVHYTGTISQKNDYHKIFPQSLNDFSGMTFRASAFNFPPYSIIDFESDTYGGIELNIANESAFALNLIMKVHSPIDGYTWGVERAPDVWTGVMGDLQFGRADITWGHFFMVGKRMRVMDYTQWYFLDPTCAMVPTSTQAASKIFAIFRPLDLYTWLGILGMMLGMMVLFSIEIGLSKYKKETTLSMLSYYMVYVIGLTMQQYHEQTFKINGYLMRAITFLYLFSCLMLYSGYSGALKSLLTVTVYPSPPNTFAELAKVATEQNWVITTCCEPMVYQMAESSDPNKRAIAEKLWLNTYEVDGWREQSFLNVSDFKTGHLRKGQQYATVNTIKTLQDVQFNMLSDEAGNTDVHIMDDCFYEIAIAFGLGKNSPYKESLDRKITQLREGGFIHKWMKAGEVKKEIHSHARKDTPFSMEQLQGLFYLYLLLITLSFTVFVFEYLFRFCTKLGERHRDTERRKMNDTKSQGRKGKNCHSFRPLPL